MHKPPSLRGISRNYGAPSPRSSGMFLIRSRTTREACGVALSARPQLNLIPNCQHVQPRGFPTRCTSSVQPKPLSKAVIVPSTSTTKN